MTIWRLGYWLFIPKVVDNRCILTSGGRGRSFMSAVSLLANGVMDRPGSMDSVHVNPSVFPATNRQCDRI